MRYLLASLDPRHRRSVPCQRALLAAVCLALTLSIVGCSGGGIYANIDIDGPSVDVGPVTIRTGVNIGRWL